MPSKLVVYLDLLDMVRGMYAKYETKAFIVNLLMAPPYSLTRYFATRVYHETLNFFYCDNDVKQKAWQNIYANHLDNLAYYAIEKDDIDTARACFMDAAKLRGVGREEKTEMPPEMYNRPVIIYTIDAVKAGIKEASRKELAEFIDAIPEISERERVRITKDAGISDITLFEEIVDEKNKG